MGAMFSKEEFDIMIEQLLDRNHASFDMLCSIAEKTLRSAVTRWCASDEALRGRRYEDDIMQEIQLRLIKTCKSSFLLRNGVDGPINNDPTVEYKINGADYKKTAEFKCVYYMKKWYVSKFDLK